MSEGATYPRWMFHETKAPEGRLIVSAAEEPTGAGWVTTPQAFDPAWKPPPLDPPEMRPIPGMPAVGPRQPYPSWRFSASEEPVVVESAAEDAALGDGWYRSPADLPNAPNPVAVAEALSEAAVARRAELYAGTVPDIVARIAKTTEAASLELWRSYEEKNPKGARKGVLTALAARLATLAPVPEED